MDRHDARHEAHDMAHVGSSDSKHYDGQLTGISGPTSLFSYPGTQQSSTNVIKVIINVIAMSIFSTDCFFAIILLKIFVILFTVSFRKQ